MEAPIVTARRIVADRIVQPYNKRAVLNGDWDTGTLVQKELRKILDKENDHAAVA